MGKLTKAQRWVLTKLAERGGTASDSSLAYPRSYMMQRLLRAGLVSIRGPVRIGGDGPAHDGSWLLTNAGRAALGAGDLTRPQLAMLKRIVDADQHGLNTSVSITNPSAAALRRMGRLKWVFGGASGYGRWEPTEAGRAALSSAEGREP